MTMYTQMGTSCPFRERLIMPAFCRRVDGDKGDDHDQISDQIIDKGTVPLLLHLVRHLTPFSRIFLPRSPAGFTSRITISTANTMASPSSVEM